MSIGAALGLAGGLMDRSNKKRLQQDSGNPFAGKLHGESEKALSDYLNRDAAAGSREFMDDPLLGTAYKQGQGYLDELSGDLGNVRSEERDLATRGYSLQPEDFEAYGQASGNIARQFGRSGSNLQAALANRGIKGAGVGQAFASQAGNKMEQLAGLQRQIANDRMQSNLNRLTQTRNFMSSLTGQRSNLLGQQQGFAQEGANSKNAFAQNKAQMGQGNLAQMAGIASENLAQQRAVAPGSWLSSALGGASRGAMAEANLGINALSAMRGGSPQPVQSPGPTSPGQKPQQGG